MICPFCKKEIPDRIQFCPECGQSISSAENLSSNASSAYWNTVEREVNRDNKLRADAENKIIEKRKQKKRAAIGVLVCVAVVAIVICYFSIIRPAQQYSKAGQLLENGNYQEALDLYSALGDYRDATSKIVECNDAIKESDYESALESYNAGNFEEALEMFSSLGGYRDSNKYIIECRENVYLSKYNSAISLFESQNYNDALEMFDSIEGYSDSGTYAEICREYIDGSRWDDVVDGMIYSSTYLETCHIVRRESYQGNEGDSFVDVIGINSNSRGNRSIDGKTYSHGVEAWIARWNYTSEISWAYATFDLGEQYTTLSGHVTLIESYNTDNFDSTLYFYDGERVIESYRLSPQTIPFDFSINVAGVSQLKVYVGDNVAVAGGTSFGIVDAVLSTCQDKLHDSRISEVSQPESVDQINYMDSTPFQQKYWVIFTEGYRSNRVEASTVDSSIPADQLSIVWDSALEINDSSGSNGCDQYYLDDDGEWVYIGNYHCLTDNATTVLASNLDVVDRNGNVIVPRSPYSMIDWNEVDSYR